MNLEFKQYTNEDYDSWEEINKDAGGTFLTSRPWIEFQESLGRNTDSYLIYSEDELVGNIYIEIYRRKIAKFAYSPYGPVIESSAIGNQPAIIFKEIKKFQKKYIRENNLNAFRMDPWIEVRFRNIFLNLGYKISMAPTQAKYVWEVDISKPEDEILASLKKVTRYNVRSSEKAGIEVEKISDVKQIDDFYEILSTTFKRHGFASFSKEYFVEQFNLLEEKGMCNLYLTKYNDKYISGALINIYGDTAYYSHGGSVNDKELQKFGASYLLHWEIIKDLKKIGIEKYNMWGVVPEDSNHPMSGVSDFKRKFPGEEIDLVGGLDLPNGWKYKIQRLAEWWSYRNDRY